ncbi:phage portal protein [uncultured Paraglaciecola sp.]|uniref:phage portal protein n=1 Tax=uncultured Paraglaciecola sp. TaxID=1765024 RepID=UPI00261C4728|nr:phage portal protein [uncultured Paraglaciecola sp.]
MAFFDHIVGVFSPKRQLDNMRTRRAIEIMQKRGYDGAKTGRRTSGWVAPSTSANSEITPSLVKLRDRSRDLVRNNPYASKSMRVLTCNVVGTGIVPSIPDEKTAELWESWAFESDQCDADGCLDFYGIQKIVARTLFESGECIVRFIHKKASDGLVVPLQLQVLEPDYLDSTKHEKLKNGGYIQHGIEYDGEGKRVAYWLYRRHPGENTPLSIGLESFRVVSQDIIHVYEKLRPGQSRGVPVLAPSMITSNDLDEYEEATLVRKAAEACITAVVQSDDDGAEIGRVSEEQGTGRKIEELSPGMIEYLNGGESITFNNPPASTGYSEYVNTRLHAIAAGSGVTYEQMTGDLSQVNFSSIRSGTLDFRREVEQIQWLVFIPMFCRRVIRTWSRSATLAKKKTKLPSRIEWTTPRFDWVDPKKDVESETEELSTSRMSFSEAARKRGYNPQKLVEEIKKDKEMFKKAGIEYPFNGLLEEKKVEQEK